MVGGSVLIWSVGRCLVFGESVKDLSVGRWSVVGGRWPVSGGWFCNTPTDFTLIRHRLRGWTGPKYHH